MPKFMVEFSSTTYYEVEVKAPNEDEAVGIALTLVVANPNEFEVEVDGIDFTDVNEVKDDPYEGN